MTRDRRGSWRLVVVLVAAGGVLAACGQPSSRSAEQRARGGSVVAQGPAAGSVEAPVSDEALDVEPGDALELGVGADGEGDEVRAEAATAVVSAGLGGGGPRSAAEIDPPVARDDEGEGAREPSIVTPLPELCRQACINAQRLVELELSAETAPAMRQEIERALTRDCPGRCLQRASLESARCIATAKSALELAACQ